MFIHLHTHSYYSFLEGQSAPSDLVNAAASMDMPAVALTDVNCLSGAIEFYDACLAKGLKPILGLELKVVLPLDLSINGIETRPDVVILATDLSGWSSLCHLSSSVQFTPTPSSSPHVSFELLAQHTSGLICLANGRNILNRESDNNMSLEKYFSRYLGSLHELFPKRLYCELPLDHPNKTFHLLKLVEMARKVNLPFVATNNVHFILPDQAGLQHVLGAMRFNRTVKIVSPDQTATQWAHFASEKDISLRLAFLTEKISIKARVTTLEINDRCQLHLPLGVLHYPSLKDSKTSTYSNEDLVQLLRTKAEEGAKQLYKFELNDNVKNEIIKTRLMHEINIINDMGYTPLFLIMEEIINFAKQVGIPISSRGSAASSLVAHCLGITSPDPIKLNLYFERFLNPARATPPDIDTDICSRRRDEVINFVYQRFGQDRVAMVGTINCFRRRSALREVAKAYGLKNREVNALISHLPYRRSYQDEQGSSSSSPYQELTNRYPSSLYRQIFRDAGLILGFPHHLSIHPGGVVIGPDNLQDLVPTQMPTKGVLITQFDLHSIERLGLIKIDLLGIRGLSVLGEVAKKVTEHNKLKAEKPISLLATIPSDDPLCADLVRHGRTIGCFQIESPGMRATLKEIQACNEDDLLVALALYRPGPLIGGLKADYVRRHKRVEEVTHIHPSLEPLLSETHGVILYQEQVLRIASELAGFSLVDADLLRRAMSHFDPGKKMQTLKEKFITGVINNNKMPMDIAEKVWELMAAFSGYGFPKAHAASYARVAWQSAWCKAHFPAEFMAAVMANWGGYYSQRVYLSEARRLGLKLHPPHVNFSQAEFTLVHQEDESFLFMGLNQVRELTRRTLDRIIRFRPYDSFNEFLMKVDPRPIEAEYLVKVGAFEGMGNIPTLLAMVKKKSWQVGQIPLFSTEQMVHGHPSDRLDWSKEEMVAAQEEVLGVSVDIHPLELHSEKIKKYGAITTLDAAAQIGNRVKVAGMRLAWRRRTRSDGKRYYWLSLEDLEGMLDVIISGENIDLQKVQFSSPGPYIIEGIVEFNPDMSEPYIRAYNIRIVA